MRLKAPQRRDFKAWVSRGIEYHSIKQKACKADFKAKGRETTLPLG
jgi:hypothetical protein